MSKKVLKIQNPNCIVSVSEFGINVDGQSIHNLILDKMPKLEHFKQYAGSIVIQITVHDETCSQIQTFGYKLQKKKDEFKIDPATAEALIAADIEDGGNQ